MARFDWPRFLRQHRIEFVTKGPNTARHHISIRCPWCGEADPSEHMGISLRGQGWGCLRNSAHRGRSNFRLVQKLLNCSAQEAQRLVGGSEAQAPTIDDFAASAAALRKMAGTTAPEDRGPLRMPQSFKPLLNGSVFSRPFTTYMQKRGYRDAQIHWLGENYDMRYCVDGDFAQRLIIPVRDRYGELLTWTGRSIQQDAIPRYKTLRVTPHEDYPDAPVAKLPVNHTVLGLPVLWAAPNPRALVLVEGPLDALKLTAYGRAFGLYGAALFGLNVYAEQVSEILQLAGRFEQTFLLLDEDANLQRLRLMRTLGPLGVQALKMPPGSDDPGAMTGAEVAELALNVLG